MPRTRRGLTTAPAAGALLAAALGLCACQADLGNADCQLTQQTVLAGSPSSVLLLLPNLRIDQVGAGFFLIGSDGTAVRWAAMAADGTLSNEQAFALPAGATNSFYAVAGASAPGDTVLIGTLAASATAGQGELDVVAVSADGSQAPTPPNPLVTFPGGVPSASTVAMMSSRSGSVAGLAWVDAQANRAMFTTVTGQGALVGAPVAVGASAVLDATTAFDCLAFSPGKSPLTLSYVNDTADQPDSPIGVIAEANDGGTIDSTTTLNYNSPVGCATVTPTDTGYGLVWQDDQGSWFTDYMTGVNHFTPQTFVLASSFGGADLQPPLVGLAPFGTDFGVVLARAHDVELWRLDDMGNRSPGSLVFPSLNGNLGGVSTLLFNGGLLATYADYSSAPGAPTFAGRRLLVNAVCY